ncbi:peptidoglycan-binding domain-containing protein [Kitasatospora camelliae]|uniref:Peptidoglycan-binding domain-containing protein n=1 Tax=Kitasatospora camelliae TaxID=3156397 RepID=A0AAU8JYV7_9ACTN
MGAIEEPGAGGAPGAPPTEPDEPAGPTGRRRRVLLYAVATAVLVSAAGVGAGAVIRSSAQVAAEQPPPPADVLTAAVERRVLVDSVVLRGQVTAVQTVVVTPVPPGGGRAVITRLPVPAGGSVEPGRPIAEVSGRPVFALPGELPVYRDLRPGTTGPDVKQLQQALETLGFTSAGDAPGTYGPKTAAAVKSFYTSQGYDPLPAQPDGPARVAAAEDAVTAGQRAVEDARDARRAAAGTSGSTAARRKETRATEDLTKLRQRLTEAQDAAAAMVPATEVVYLTGFPARVDAVAGRIGGDVTGGLLTVSAGALVAKATLTPAQKRLVQVGQTASIVSEQNGLTTTATVASVSDGQLTGPGTGTADGGGTGPQTAFQMVLQPGRPLDPGSLGEEVRLTVQAAASTEPVLVVPVSAVASTPDGKTQVTVVRDGRREQVEVVCGMTGGGSVEVRPVEGAVLADGEQVVVGVRNGPA